MGKAGPILPCGNARRCSIDRGADGDAGDLRRHDRSAHRRAYYWTWSKENVLSFLDHPPMIAWFVRFGTAIFGDTNLACGLPASLRMLSRNYCSPIRPAHDA